MWIPQNCILPKDYSFLYPTEAKKESSSNHHCENLMSFLEIMTLKMGRGLLKTKLLGVSPLQLIHTPLQSSVRSNIKVPTSL
jgi:hypothetical protein